MFGLGKLIPMHPLRRVTRLTTAILWYGFVAVVVIAAVVLTVARLVIPEVAEYRRQVEALASDYLGQPVSIAALDARLAGLRPSIVFEQVQLLDSEGEQPLARFDEARVQIAVIESLRAGRLQPAGLTVAGVQLAVTRVEDGSLVVQGLERRDRTPKANSGLSEWFFERDYIAIEDSELVWTDHRAGAEPLHFTDVALQLRNHRGRHQLDGKLQLPASLGRELEIALDMAGPGLRPAAWRGEFYVRGAGLEAGEWRRRLPQAQLPTTGGRADLELWGHLSAGRLHRIVGEFHATAPRLRSDSGTAAFDSIRSRLRWTRHGRGAWQLDLDGLEVARDGRAWPGSRLTLTRDVGEQWVLRSEYLHLADARQLLLAAAPGPASRWAALRELAPEGELHGVELRWEADAPRYALRARFEGLGWREWERLPGMTGVSGRVWADQAGGTLWLDEAAGSFEYLRLFRSTVPVSSARGVMHWRDEGTGWRIVVPEFDLATPDLQARAGMQLILPKEQAPYLDLQLTLDQARLAATARYLPVGIMPPRLVHWLDEAMHGGRLAEGGLVYRGKLDGFPLKHADSRFLAEVRVDDLDLQYRPDWPRVQGAAARARFTDRGMEIDLERGRLAANPLRPTRLRIRDFLNAFLEVRGAADGDVPGLLHFLRVSPLGHGREAWLADAAGAGPVEVQLELGVPLHPRIATERPLDYSGIVRLQDSALRLLDGRVDLSELRGGIEFDRSGLHAEKIEGRLLGGPAEFALDTQPLPDGEVVAVLRGKGQFAADALNNRFKSPAVARLSGATGWWGRMSLGQRHADGPGLHVQLNSALLGLGLDLPGPLGKSASEQRALSVVYNGFSDRRELRAVLGERAATALEWDARGERLIRGAVRFGASRVELPEEALFRVAGVLEDLPADAWQGLAGGAGLAGADTVGTPLPLSIELDRLTLRRADTKDPVRGSSDTVAESPGRLPPIRGRVGQLAYEDMDLGTATFSLVPHDKGVYLEHLSLDSALMRLNANGEWRKRPFGSQSKLDFTVAGDDIGGLLDHLGYASVIRGGSGQASVSLQWPGPPGDFNAERLGGRVRLDLKDGYIEEVKPGAGRLLGLLSLDALPRRLLLDFSDVFNKGLRFDAMGGSSRLANGHAYTDDVFLEGPSGRIELEGRTGLVDRDYEHLVTVMPGLGDSLPLAGGLAWGPQVGAAILIVQRLFRSQIDRATQFQYRVTGTWNSPQIKRVDRQERPGRSPEQPN